MAKKNWFDNIEDLVPASTVEAANRYFDLMFPGNVRHLRETLFEEPYDVLIPDRHFKPLSSLMEGLDGLGFQDKGKYYEMVTNIGGQKGNEGVPEDAVKIELGGEDGRMLEITYDHSTSEDEKSFYRHSQKTVVMLPVDADLETLKANFDEHDNVVVTVKKEEIRKEPNSRSIPIGRNGE